MFQVLQYGSRYPVSNPLSVWLKHHKDSRLKCYYTELTVLYCHIELFI